MEETKKRAAAAEELDGEEKIGKDEVTPLEMMPVREWGRGYKVATQHNIGT